MVLDVGDIVVGERLCHLLSLPAKCGLDADEGGIGHDTARGKVAAASMAIQIRQHFSVICPHVRVTKWADLW